MGVELKMLKKFLVYSHYKHVCSHNNKKNICYITISLFFSSLSSVALFSSFWKLKGGWCIQTAAQSANDMHKMNELHINVAHQNLQIMFCSLSVQLWDIHAWIVPSFHFEVVARIALLHI